MISKYAYDPSVIVNGSEFHSYNLGYAISVSSPDLFHYGPGPAKTFDQVIFAIVLIYVSSFLFSVSKFMELCINNVASNTFYQQINHIPFYY